MKKTSTCLLSLLLAALCLVTACLTGCEEYNPAVTPPGHGHTESGEESTEVVTDNEGNIDPDPFTVTLTVNGKPFAPSSVRPISVRWSDGFSLHTAEVNSKGEAKIGGLDGDYQVTLSDVPAGYAYNPNIYRATNESRQINIELYKIVETKGKGIDRYNAIHIKNTGLYCVEITGGDKEVFYEFAPTVSGTYSVESWMDITADNVNPATNYYGASAAYREFRYRVDDGGSESAYTKNFKLNVQIADENISQSSAGSAVFTFGVIATSKTNEYPIKVYFAVTLDGEFSLNYAQAQMMEPTAGLKAQQEYDGNYEFVGAEFRETVGDVTGWTFDADNYRLWPEEEGGDGYYHLYNLEDYPQTHGFGPILYAKISSPCRFLGEPFTMVEYQGNKALTLSNGTENYKLFIEGYAALNNFTMSPSNPNGKPPYFCTLDCPCRKEGTNDSVAITGNVGCCIIGCEKCHPDCNNLPESLIGQKGYGNYTNSDGCYAVTEELKEFLQKYSISQLLFFDGDGFVETHETIRIFAEEEDQWLFACGYYKPVS